MKDAEWLRLMESSPRKARESLVDEYKNLVYAIVLSKLKGSASLEEIEDCVSDVFMDVFGSIERFSPNKGTLKAFISTIAVRVSVSAFKRNMYHRSKTSSIDDEDISLPPSDEDTESAVQDSAFRKRLWEVVDSLGEPDARIIVCQYCYELTAREIAALLSMTPDAVQKRSIRARERIKAVLEKENLI